MASSAKFLEEALSTDVDESAVSAIVGSLENQLGTPTSVVPCQQILSTNVNQNHLHSDISNGSSASIQKHGTANGQADTMSIILNSESNKGITSNNHQLGNITQPITNSTVQGVVCSASFANQIPSNVGIVQCSTANLTKTQDGLKTVFTTIQTAVSTASSPRVAYQMQNVNSLPNGNLNLTSIPANSVLNVSNANIQGMVSQTFTQSNSNNSYHKITPVGNEQNKQQGTAVIIKSNACNNISTGVSSQMTTAISLSGAQLNNTVTLAKPTTASGAQTIVGNTPILSNLQLVNINALRTASPVQTGNKTTASPRLMFPQVVRPGGTGQITLQALSGLPAAQGGHLLLKTENGQFQLVRIGPPANTAVTQNNTATALPAGSYRLTVPVCCVPQTSSTASNVQTVTTQSAIQSGAIQRGADNTKEKCRKFITNLLELSSKEPRAVERNVRTLIQELIDSKVEPEEFCDRLERLLSASPQPCLIGFLKKSLPGLRAAMIAKEISIDGIRPPPAPTQSAATVVLAAPSVVQAQLQNNQVRPVQIGSVQQMRVVPQTTLATGTRPQQQIQHRIITPVRLQTATSGTAGAISGMKVVTTSTMPTVAAAVRIQSPLPATGSASTADTVGTTTATMQLVPSSSGGATIVTASQTPTTTAIRLTTPIRQTLVKTMPMKTTAATTTPVTVRTSTLATAASKSGAAAGTKNNFISKSPMLAGIGKQQTPSSQSKAAAKERERKAAAAVAASAAAAGVPASALTGGYVGDDDVNDVAAMAGVNLAEETQRILGPSEFVGTQIRSCKDETFLHTHPLTMRIMQIAAKHGLEEPSSEVVALVSHAAQERLKNIIEKLNVIAEHRVDFNKADEHYEISHDIRGQLRCLEELDKVERKRHDEMERELLLRAAKSRSKSEDPEQVKLKAKAKELQRAEMEELRQREANNTALQAIGPRKKIKLDTTDSGSASGPGGSLNVTSRANRLSLANRPRLKRVTVRDFLYVMEKEKHINRSPFLYKSYLK